MNKKSTFFWFVLAAALFASIYLLDRYLRPPAVTTRNVLPALRAEDVTSLQVIPAGALEIRAERVNNTWLLSKPMAYPAQPAAIEALLTALQKLTPATRISAAEFHEHRTAETDFGFDVPQVSLVIEAGEQRWQVLIGNKTAPGDQVFIRVVGMEGAFVTDAGWLRFVPHSGNDWRSTALAAADAATCDGIVLTNNTKIIELRRDATNHLWRMIRPLQARADTGRITEALQQLQTANVAQFVTDNAKADLTTFGLQPPDLALWLYRGTNYLSALQTGNAATNDAAQVYLKRERWNVVAATAREPLALWHGAVNDFRDPFLLELTAPVSEIEVHGKANFILKQQGTNGWSVAGETFPADTENVQLFLKVLAGLRISEFVKAAVTAPDLPDYGLDAPQREIILRTPAGDSNAVLAQLDFAVQTNGVFVHRPDEDFIYAIKPEDFNRLPESGWEFRDRRIWNFSENDVTNITLHQSGRTRALVHNGPNKWSLAPGSEGIVNPAALEETAHRLGQLTATGWVGRKVTAPEKYGLNPENLEITVELKSGEKLSVNFGTEISNQTALAAVTLDGERWAFVFPATLYQFVLSYLTIPANVR
jgi:hypothetical protein